MAKYRLIDCCPVPRKMYPLIMEVKRRTGASLVSCYRAADVEGLLARCGKLSQAQLYYRWVHRWPGYNPANPPGRSTHELRSDGVAYVGPVGRRLRWYQVGMDWSDSSKAVKAFNELGYAHITYPGDPREAHHINVYRKPKRRLMKFLRYIYEGRVMHRGMKGKDVKNLVWRLRYINQLPDGWRPTLGKEGVVVFDDRLEKQVKEFQRKYFHKGDGVVGPQTKRQLAVLVRRKRRRLAAARDA